MSLTPKTDAACGWPWGHHGRIETADLRWSPDGPFVHSSVARELERENAALRNEIVRLNNQTMWVCSCGGTDCAGQKENTALRADRDRLEWLVTPDGTEWLTWQCVAGGPTDGAAIDAARKEAQP